MQDIISDLRHMRHLININTVCVVLPTNLIKLVYVNYNEVCGCHVYTNG